MRHSSPCPSLKWHSERLVICTATPTNHLSYHTTDKVATALFCPEVAPAPACTQWSANWDHISIEALSSFLSTWLMPKHWSLCCPSRSHT